MDENKKNLLEVKDLKVSFFTPAGEVKAVDGISYNLGYNEVMGIVGESGSGKSVEAYSIIGLLQSPGKVTGGSVTLCGREITALPEKERPFQWRSEWTAADGPAALYLTVNARGTYLSASFWAPE